MFNHSQLNCIKGPKYCASRGYIFRSVVKWREFRENFKNCDNSDLLSKTHTRLTQCFKLVKNRRKNLFLIYLSRVNGCQQRLLFAQQRTQRKCSLCSQGIELLELFTISSTYLSVNLENLDQFWKFVGID